MTTTEISRRMERASKLLDGVKIIPKVGAVVHGSTGKKYLVHRPYPKTKANTRFNTLACSCSDWHRHGPGWRCKHVMAVEEFWAGQRKEFTDSK